MRVHVRTYIQRRRRAKVTAKMRSRDREELKELYVNTSRVRGVDTYVCSWKCLFSCDKMEPLARVLVQGGDVKTRTSDDRMHVSPSRLAADCVTSIWIARK